MWDPVQVYKHFNSLWVTIISCFLSFSPLHSHPLCFSFFLTLLTCGSQFPILNSLCILACRIPWLGTWWVTVHGAAKSGTRLKGLNTHEVPRMVSASLTLLSQLLLQQNTTDQVASPTENSEPGKCKFREPTWAGSSCLVNNHCVLRKLQLLSLPNRALIPCQGVHSHDLVST